MLLLRCEIGCTKTLTMVFHTDTADYSFSWTDYKYHHFFTVTLTGGMN